MKRRDAETSRERKHRRRGALAPESTARKRRDSLRTCSNTGNGIWNREFPRLRDSRRDRRGLRDAFYTSRSRQKAPPINPQRSLITHSHGSLSHFLSPFPFFSLFPSSPTEGKKIERRSGPLFMRASRDRFLLLFKRPTTAQWTNRPRGAARRGARWSARYLLMQRGNYVK